MNNNSYDLIVIGGGINGCGIARDAALRGLNVTLVEQADLCSGTSAQSTKLIHGGLRYLEYAEFPLVYESLHERRRLFELAPHLVHPMEFAIPIYADRAYRRWKIGIGLTLYDLLTGIERTVPRHQSMSAVTLRGEIPSLQADELEGGFTYYDGSCPYPERLTLELALDAENAGATILTRHRVEAILQTSETNVVSGVRARDVDSGEEVELRANVVVNAAGPWVDKILGIVRGVDSDRMGGTRGMHLLLPKRESGPIGALYTPAKTDGRPFFVTPWRDYYWVGTTDIPHEDPDTAVPTEQETEYLLTELRLLLPGLGYSADDIHYALTGVRPLPKHDFDKPGAITRRHIVFDHEREDDVPGMISIIGGKLTTFRNLAEQTVDTVFHKLGRKAPPCPTRDRPLLGAGDIERPAGVDPTLWDHLYSLYGRRAVGVIVLANRDAKLLERLDPTLPDIGAQVVWACRHEHCKHIDDFLLRRSGIGTGHTEGFGCLDAVADLMVSELGWTAERRASEIATYRTIIQREHRASPS